MKSVTCLSMFRFRIWVLLFFVWFGAETEKVFCQSNKDRPAASKISAKERKDLLAINDTADIKAKADLMEKFLVKFPKSGYKTQILQMAVHAYATLDDHRKIVEHGENLLKMSIPDDLKQSLYYQMAYSYNRLSYVAKSVEYGHKLLKEFPGSPHQEDTLQLLAFAYRHSDERKSTEMAERFLQEFPQSKNAPNLYQLLLANFHTTGEISKSIEYGEKYLAIRPNDVQTLSLLALAYGSKNNCEQAVAKAKAANDLLDKGESKPEDVDPQAWAKITRGWKATNLSTLGTCHLRSGGDLGDKTARKQEFEAAATCFLGAVALNPRDDFSYHRLGLTYELLENWPSALNAYAMAVSAGQGGSVSTSRQDLEKLYRRLHDNSLDGLEALLAKAAQDIRTAEAGIAP